MTPAEITAAITAFNLLEPELQKVAALVIHGLSNVNPKIVAANAAAVAAGVPSAKLPNP